MADPVEKKQKMTGAFGGERLRIALLEDDEDQADLVRLWLEEAEHTISVFANGEDFLRGVRRESFDLYLLDWMLPDISGIDVLKKLRSGNKDDTPVMLATTRHEEKDIVAALEAGADDYLVKPVRRRELIARLDALCRRYGVVSDSEELDVEPYSLDLGSKTLSLRGEAISLTNREFELALFLFRQEGRAISRNHILETIWDIDSPDVSTRTVDTHISRLRKKMHVNEDNGWKLAAIYQHGYRLERITDNKKKQDQP
ncbi:MAG: response regulator transcription factor [Pseudomonadota bacterium]